MKSSLFAAAAALSLLAFASAQAAPAAPTGLATEVKRTFKTPVNCKGVQNCNNIISYCAENSGVWKETSHNQQGQPTAGRCTLPN